jgi:uncharacterized membrane protein
MDSSIPIKAKTTLAGPGRIRWGWASAVACTATLVVLSALPPFVPPPVRAILMEAFSPFCHQLPLRSPHLDGVQLAACHRCIGLYWGLLLGTLSLGLLYDKRTTLRRYAPFVVGASVLPLSIDWGGDAIGLWVNTPLSRFLTGGLFGLVAGYYLAHAIVELVPGRRGAGTERVRKVPVAGHSQGE